MLGASDEFASVSSKNRLIDLSEATPVGACEFGGGGGGGDSGGGFELQDLDFDLDGEEHVWGLAVADRKTAFGGGGGG